MRDPECETASYDKYARVDNCELKKKTNPKDCQKSAKEKHNKYVKKVKEVSNTQKLFLYACRLLNLGMF